MIMTFEWPNFSESLSKSCNIPKDNMRKAAFCVKPTKSYFFIAQLLWKVAITEKLEAVFSYERRTGVTSEYKRNISLERTSSLILTAKLIIISLYQWKDKIFFLFFLLKISILKKWGSETWGL